LAAELPSQSADNAFRSGLAILNAGFPELLVPPARLLADRHAADPRMMQLLGLAARADRDGPLAYRAFAKAARLAPRDALIAHSHARTALEAGKPSIDLFRTARAMAPADGTILQGLAAALYAEGRAGDALQVLADALGTSALWLEGHRSFAHIAGQTGQDPLGTIERALGGLPRQADLHRLRIAILQEARRLDEVLPAIDAATSSLGEQPWLVTLAAHASSEIGDFEEADRLFDASPDIATAGDAAMLARHQLRADRPDEAATTMEPWLQRDGRETLFPYASLAWRLLGDPRSEWLDRDGAFVRQFDIVERIDDFPALVAHIRSLHVARAAPLDQSVRHGTQTDGDLFLRDEVPIQALRKVILECVAQYAAELPEAVQGHPTLIERRIPARMAGSWSVRLKGAGYHTDHIHSQGWISSALYLALPDTMGSSDGSDPHAGWLTLGECRELAPSLAPYRKIEPKIGQLVLFPSTMWHGTRPFSAGERLTVAFDIARPKQD
jgi:tetratricopeptide (TPR) repeat protein